MTYQRSAKRMLDVVLSIVMLGFSVPIFAIIAILVPLDSSGPAFFVQRRVGRDQRMFDCYKFRSMHLQTGDMPTHLVPQSAVTRIGKVLRATKLDELPQLFNVLKGEMSLVGPRPCLPTQLDLLSARGERGVLTSIPGITGLAQVRGFDMADPIAVAKSDAEYLLRQTFVLDLRVLVATIIGPRSVGLQLEQ